MSNSRRWREFINWWSDVYATRRCGKHSDVNSLIQSINDKIRDIEIKEGEKEFTEELRDKINKIILEASLHNYKDGDKCATPKD